MEFHEKLQELRKQKGLTQEELSGALFVSRTAISKWESGRGYPNIDSLKAIAKFYCVTVDELLSGEEILTIAEEAQKQRQNHIRDMLFGLLDLSMALLLFLPLFGQKAGAGVQGVSLLALTDIQPYLKGAYLAVVITMAVQGVLLLALQNCRRAGWTRSKTLLSLLLSIVGVCLFVISQQPYAAIFAFAFLVIKALVLIKRR